MNAISLNFASTWNGSMTSTAHAAPYEDIECCGDIGHVTPVHAPFDPVLLAKLHAQMTLPVTR